jgi:hypothetical protein
MAFLEDTTEETLSAIAKAQTTGITSSTGVVSYDLSGVVSLIPVVTPMREKVARVKSPNGNPYAVWRALLNLNNAQSSPTPGLDYAANEVLFSEQDFQAKYQAIGYAGFVTQDAFDLAQGIFDPYANATFQTLNQCLIGEDRLLVGGQSFALARPAAPTITQAATGGSIGATTVYVGVAARTGYNYFYGGGNSRGNSASTTFASGSTNKVTATIPAVRGAVAYDWFQSANGTTWYYHSTTTVASVVMTSVISANAAANTTLVDLNSTIPTFLASGDNGSAQANNIDGLLATLTGDYNSTGQFVQSGSATANPSQFIDGGGAALSLSGGSVTQIETLFAQIYGAVKASPTALMVSPNTAQSIANLVLGSTAAVTYLQTDAEGRVNTTAGGRVGQIVNTPAGGTLVPIEVHPSVVDGTIIARTDRVPFPQSGISSTLEVRTLRDYSQFDYGTNRVAATAGGGPRKEFEIRSVEAFVNRAPVSMGVLSNII